MTTLGSPERGSLRESITPSLLAVSLLMWRRGSSFFAGFVHRTTGAGNRHLVESCAGRMNLVNKMVHPENRKGLVYVYQAENGLIHICWKNRTTGNVEDDLIVFPDDGEFKKIEHVNNGRVFLLKYKSSSHRLFFWMQESKTDKVEEGYRRINELINNSPSSNNLGERSGRGGNGSDNGDLQYIM